MIISQIAAISKNFVIGKNNSLPWKMPDDLNYFHKVTRDHMVLMGRKNYEANGGALKNRTNIVVTRKDDFHPDDAIVFNKIEPAIKYAASFLPKEVFIVGGGEIYRQTLAMADRLYITVIDIEIEGDTFYPEINFSDYHTISKIEKQADEKNPYDHTYYILEPISK